MPESIYKDPPCQIEHKCPWGVRPVVGMWKQFDDGSQLFATDCLSRYKGCPRFNWTHKQWKANRIAKAKADLIAAAPLMKCGNKLEFQHRLQWLSEGVLHSLMHNVINYTIDEREIEIYRKFKEATK